MVRTCSAYMITAEIQLQLWSGWKYGLAVCRSADQKWGQKSKLHCQTDFVSVICGAYLWFTGSEHSRSFVRCSCDFRLMTHVLAQQKIF